MKLSVIILNYNVEHFLYQCLLSVQRAIEQIDAEIIVVDNNSTDDSCAMVRKYFPNVILIAHPENSGFPKGNNIGVEASKGEYICILNPDTIVGEDTLVNFLDFAKKKSKLGIMGPMMIDGKGDFLPESKRGVPTPYVALTKILGLYKIMPTYFSQYYTGHLRENQEGEVSILVGACMMMRKELYQSVGGFDEKCFMYSDDIDLSYMILKKGYINYYLPHWPIIHYKGESTIRDGEYVKRFRDAMNFFYKKHFRSAVFFNIFMEAGALAFSLAKRFHKDPITPPPGQYILISSNLSLHQEIEEYLRSQVIRKDEFYEVDSIWMSYKPTQVIVDTSNLRFKDIIAAMQRLKEENITFRLHYKAIDGLEFLIGSDSSNNRGEVTLLKNPGDENLLANNKL